VKQVTLHWFNLETITLSRSFDTHSHPKLIFLNVLQKNLHFIQLHYERHKLLTKRH